MVMKWWFVRRGRFMGREGRRGAATKEHNPGFGDFDAKNMRK
jgi:hypothetical protein